jgi:hypothetical protein
MKTLGLYIILCFTFGIQLKAQTNLVPNYSFEDKNACPRYSSEIDPICKNWFTPINEMQVLPPSFFHRWLGYK